MSFLGKLIGKIVPVEPKEHEYTTRYPEWVPIVAEPESVNVLSAVMTTVTMPASTESKPESSD